MKKLILRFSLFFSLLAAVYAFALWQVAQGQVDFFYPKFTHQAGSLVLGISRGHYGVSPAVVEKNFRKDEIGYPVLNFAFVLDYSRYGSVYYRAIQKKLYPDTQNGLFLLEVNPVALSLYQWQADSADLILENDVYLSEINHFNQNPNLEYIRKMYYASLYMGFNRKRIIDTLKYLHADGWLEVKKNSENYEFSQDQINEWTQKSLDGANHLREYSKPSKVRVEYLHKIIAYLKNHGRVFLFRAPISPEFLEIEQGLWPGFNAEMEEIAARHDIIYFNFSEDTDSYGFYDGSHLFGCSAITFTQKLCDTIKALD